MSDRDSADYETKAFFTIRGPTVVPDEITEHMQITPSKTSDDPLNPGAKRRNNDGFWRYKNDESSTLKVRSIESTLKSLLDNSDLKLDRIRSLPKEFEKTFIVTIFSDDRPCFFLSPELMAVLAEIGVSVELSIYAGSD